MGADEVQTVVDMVLKPKQKTENRKILVIIICALVPTVLFGVDIGEWREWRKDMERCVSDLEHSKANTAYHAAAKNIFP
jgi:hypothetical protein